MIPARWRWRLLVAVVLVGASVLVLRGANRPDDPELAPTSNGAPDGGDEASGAGGRSPLAGFEEVAFRIEGAGTAASTWCALQADQQPERQQGLSGQEDLRGYDGMAFRFPEPAAARFTMEDTLIPLSIAFFDQAGAFLSAIDMDPCPEGTEDCPAYGTEERFTTALEVAQGDLPRLGIGEGARITFPGGGCPA